MKLLKRQRHRAGGFTLLELVISLGLTSVMVGAAVMIQVAGTNALQSSNQQLEAEGKARRGLDRVAQELERAIIMDVWTNFTPLAPDSPELSYLNVGGLVDGVMVPGHATRIRLEPDPRDPNNGVDDDGDGLIDEGVVVLYRNLLEADEIRVVICSDVTEFFAGETGNGADDNGNGLTDEAGFHFEQDGDLITVRICVAGVSSEGTTVIRTAETSIRLRN